MSDIVAFLTARFDEREVKALAARDDLQSGDWWYEDEGEVMAGRDRYVTLDGEGIRAAVQPIMGRYIAENDPAYVLADIASKRAIMAEIEDQRDFTYTTGWDKRQTDRFLDHLLRFLAQPYAAHPDFDPAWRL